MKKARAGYLLLEALISLALLSGGLLAGLESLALMHRASKQAARARRMISCADATLVSVRDNSSLENGCTENLNVTLQRRALTPRAQQLTLTVLDTSNNREEKFETIISSL